MNEKLFNNTKLCAYFLWEYTNAENTLILWYCSEDMASFLEQHDYLTPDKIMAVLRLGVYDLGYINFVRHIAYRIYQYTNNSDSIANWFAAEHLISNYEWRVAITEMASIYASEKS
jgi:hypothetical protein